jgi:multicomponent K+:H+ antiporter subunit A
VIVARSRRPSRSAIRCASSGRSFFGPERDDYPHHPHDPGFGLWFSPGLLVVLVVLIGLMPMTMVGWLVEASASAVTGCRTHPHLALWHGVTRR